MPSVLDSLRDVWATQMPVTTALGITIDSRSESELVLRMPLAPNRNHQGTVFAGSLSALATLAGWSAIWLLMHEAGEVSHVVIQDATIHYRHPARSDTTARVALPDPEATAKVLGSFRRRGRARIPLTITLRDNSGEMVAEMTGRYVVQRQ